jgi:hypothetical protein
MMNIPRLFLFLFLASIFVTPLRAADKINCRVQFKISAAENIRGVVTSYLSRELRALGDIDIVEDDPWFILSVIAVATSNRAGNPTGYTFSVVVERPVLYRKMRDEFAKLLDEKMMKVMDISFDNTARIVSHFVQLGAVDELENLCKKVIADIDGNVFEPDRKISQQYLEMMKKIQTTPAK